MRYGRFVLTTTPAARIAFWLLSMGVHAAAFVAAGRAGAILPGAVRASSRDASIEVAWEPVPPAEDSRPVPAVAPPVPFVPPSPARVETAPVPRADVRASDRAPHSGPSGVTTEAPDVSAEAQDVVAAPAAPAHFVITVQTGPSRATAPVLEPGDDARAWAESDVSSPASLIGSTVPGYPTKAREMGVEGDVVLAIVVTSAGQVADASVVRGAGFGLDEAALAAVRVARFTPARRGGRPVAVRMRWSWAFRLR